MQDPEQLEELSLSVAPRRPCSQSCVWLAPWTQKRPFGQITNALLLPMPSLGLNVPASQASGEAGTGREEGEAAAGTRLRSSSRGGYAPPRSPPSGAGVEPIDLLRDSDGELRAGVDEAPLTVAIGMKVRRTLEAQSEATARACFTR